MARSRETADGGMGLRERNKLEKLERIGRAAWELFREKGFEAATTREIAERAQVGVGTIFLYAKTKQELLVLVYWDAIREATEEAFTTLPEGGTLADDLMHVFRRLLTCTAGARGSREPSIVSFSFHPVECGPGSEA